MTPLRETMIKMMKLRNFAPRTQKVYLSAVEKLARYYRRSPDLITVEEVQDYLIHLQEDQGLSFSSCNQAKSAILFFFTYVLKNTRLAVTTPGRRTVKKLPQVLSKEEVANVLNAVPHARDRLCLELIYSAGLRTEEVIRLKAQDIDSSRMTIRVVQGKGHKDRETVLSEKVLRRLREYWACYRPKTFLFPSRHDPENIPMCPSVIRKAFKKAMKQAGVTKSGSLHMLRHSFATHMLEAGYDIKTIQTLLGHNHISTTMIYLHISVGKASRVVSPIDTIITQDAIPVFDAGSSGGCHEKVF